MKQTITRTLVILLVCLLLPSLISATNKPFRFAQIRADLPEERIYLHAKPQEGADQTFGYCKGTFLLILEESGGWYHVSIGNQQGYLQSDKIMPADSFSATDALPVALSNPSSPTGWVNLREGPSMESAGLVRAEKDQEILVIGDQGEWAHVIYGGKLGFMMREYLTMTGSMATYEARSIEYSLYLPQTKERTASASTTPTAATTATHSIEVYAETPNPGGSIRVEYPKFNGDHAHALNAIVDKTVQNILSEHKTAMIAEHALTIDMQAAVTLYNSKMVSMVIFGTCNWGSADGIGKPFTTLHAVNIDLSTMREITFPELFRADAGLEEAYLTRSTFPTNPITSYDASLFEEMRMLQTREYRSGGPFTPLQSVQ